MPAAGEVVASQLDVPLFRPTSDGRRDPHVPGAGEVVASQLDVPLFRPTSDGRRDPQMPGAGEGVLAAENLAEAMSRRSHRNIVSLCMP